MPFTKPKDCSEFYVAIVAALARESDPFIALLDEKWTTNNGEPWEQATGDTNYYTLGRIGGHAVVITHSGMGGSEATRAASHLSCTFPNIKLCLLIGICGAAPMTKDHDPIFLGDVIVSTSVIQTDFSNQYTNGKDLRREPETQLGRPSTNVRSFIENLKGFQLKKEMEKDIISLLHQIKSEGKSPFHYPGAAADRLYPSDYLHIHRKTGQECDRCYRNSEIDQETCEVVRYTTCETLGCVDSTFMRSDQFVRIRDSLPEISSLGCPKVHFGPIACSDARIRSGVHRDQWNAKERAIGFEMELIGVWDSHSTLLIKGAGDYADGHKDNSWRTYAAAAAAGYAKLLLDKWPVQSRRQSFPNALTPSRVSSLNGSAITTSPTSFDLVSTSQYSDAQSSSPLERTFTMQSPTKTNGTNARTNSSSTAGVKSRRFSDASARAVFADEERFGESLAPVISNRPVDLDTVVEAIHNNDEQTVVRAINGGFDVNALFKSKYLPNTSKWLYKGSEFNSRNAQLTPLVLAIIQGHTAMVELLLKHGANVHTRVGNEKMTPLHYAAKSGWLEIVQILTEAGAEAQVLSMAGSTPLHKACYFGNPKCAAHLISQGANPNSANISQTTPVHMACDRGHPLVVKMLCSLRNPPIDFNVQTEHGNTPAHKAVEHGRIGCLRALMEVEDIDVNIQNSETLTPLYVACMKDNSKAVDLLLKKGANPNITQTTPKMPLNDTEDEVEQYMIEGSLSPLHVAVLRGNREIVESLLEAKANLSLRTEVGSLPEEFATLMKNHELARFLRDKREDMEHEEKVNKRRERRRTMEEGTMPDRSQLRPS